ncbi:Pre-mRNA-splicing factor of RES complex-domain-containing protein [Podospora australis]|uniref:Pre-mRNA-splicing factor of RES complex-domain-containing protein n=1 Tax=Podospora australis TaxID=1536484 RepID=A0AAN7AM81_9PEZI|nr:Pre-mRNA-splicing factor of RES complex-domain-containing protein [Podospora australis]
MPSDKAAYLAAHYLTASSSKPSSGGSKKRKRKQPKDTGLLIRDDDDDTWDAAKSRSLSDDDDVPTVSDIKSAEFRRAKKSNWQTISQADATAAEAIIAQAALDTRAAAADADDMDLDPSPPSASALLAAQAQQAEMSNGTRAGLQRASDITAQLKIRQQQEAAELAELQAARASRAHASDDEEVILRDATGRRIDISMRRAEARRQALLAQQAEEEKKLLLKGEKQQELSRQKREELENAALMPLARGKDDKELNELQKEQERWNDPMAQFLEGPSQATGTGKKKKGYGKRPVYVGAAPPNRYGIKPGYRWDGVDRGNGFEAERFKALNRRERNKGLEYAWQMDE